MSRRRTGVTGRGGVARDEIIRAARIVAFLGHYLLLLVRASAIVTREIVTPGSTLSPAIVEFRSRARTQLELAMIAHLINLTPGTLVLEVRNRPEALFVHGMHAADPQTFRRDLSDLEDRLLFATRPPRREGT